MDLNTGKGIRILAFVDYYIPGVKGGGPIRSIANLVEVLGDEFHFQIATSDSDLKAKAPYPDIMRDCWVPVGKAQVIYLSSKGRSFFGLWRLLRESKYDILYLNSFFSRRFSMVPVVLHWLGLTRRVPLLLAPRGEFSSGALKISHLRKKIYIGIAIFFGIYRKIEWHASSLYEKEDIIRIFRKYFEIKMTRPRTLLDRTKVQEKEKGKPQIKVAINLPGEFGDIYEKLSQRIKETGKLRVVFLSRVSRKKNLDGALELLKTLRGHIQYNIYGPMEDPKYWKECQDIIDGLPENINVQYCGEVPHEKVLSTLLEHEFFFLPTHGENYGHVIMEALSAGCPVLISDQTPWRDLEKKSAGWDVGLEDKDKFRTVLQRCTDMRNEEYQLLSGCAYAYGRERIADPEIIEQNRRLFRLV